MEKTCRQALQDLLSAISDLHLEMVYDPSGECYQDVKKAMRNAETILERGQP